MNHQEESNCKDITFCGIQICFNDKISVIRHSGSGRGFQETPYKLKTNQRNKSNILNIKESVGMYLYVHFEVDRL